MRPQSVLIAHSEQMLGEALAAALAASPEIVLAGVATSAQAVRASGGRLDAVAIEAGFPEACDLAGELRSRGTRVVFVGRHPGDDAWVPTDVPVTALVRSLAPLPLPRADGGRSSSLTRREKQVLDLVARGLAGKQVARHLGISPKTVEQHKTRIFAKLGVSNQTAAVCHILGGLSGDVLLAGLDGAPGRA